ncbi:hypothetical protein ACVWVY_008153 [Bradyrhizobium sp. URHC0002]
MVGAATSAITGGACSPYGFHWTFDTRALAVCTGGALMKAGGGQTVGSVGVPPNSSDFSSFLLQRRARRRKSSVSPMPAK